MRRRQFIAGLVGAAAWPIAARAQQAALPVIGWLSVWEPQQNPSYVAAFRKGLNEAGFIEGQNVAIEFRWSGEQPDRLPTLSPSTIATWLQLYQRHCSYRRFRAEGLRRFPANQTIRSIKLYHRQVYAYAYHRAKLGFLRDGTLDDKRTASAASTARFAPLADFLESVPTVCPHELFTQEEDVKARASQARPEFADASHAIVTRKENAATETAALIIPAVGNNKLRHETLQRFMLANDSVTLRLVFFLRRAAVS